MLFTKKLITSAVGRAQQADRAFHRNAAERGENPVLRAMILSINADIKIEDAYKEMDKATVEIFQSDEGDTFVNDLMPLSKSVDIGKITHQYRRVSDAGIVQTSLSGQVGFKRDQVDYSYEGSIIPIHDTSFGRNWREWAGQKSDGFDALLDDQKETTRTLRKSWADTIMDGAKDKDGLFIVQDSFSWKGMRADTSVNQIDLGAGGINFDFTDNTKTGAEIKAAFIEIRDIMWITNKVERDLTYYVSREIASNFERKFSTQYDAKIIMQELADLMGVAAIKVSSKLTGNQLMGFPLDSNAIRPIVGMGMNTVALPRAVYNSDYDFVTWHASGMEVVQDYNGTSAAFYAEA